MESLNWHQRLIDRLIQTNQSATIADYFKITDGYKYIADPVKTNQCQKNHRSSFILAIGGKTKT